MRVALILVGLSIAPAGFCQKADCDTVEKCHEILKTNRSDSLAHFRLGEMHFKDRNFQSSANEFREALNGNLSPKWIEVWAHISLGKIFDITGQRDRALNEYRMAKRTGDNTRGAQDDVAKYLEGPYKE